MTAPAPADSLDSGNETLFLLPENGSPVRVRLTEAMVESMSCEHPDYPSATNSTLAARVKELLAGGQSTVVGELVAVSGHKHPRVDAWRVCREHETVTLRCPELTGAGAATVLFTVTDCVLKPFTDSL